MPRSDPPFIGQPPTTVSRVCSAADCAEVSRRTWDAPPWRVRRSIGHSVIAGLEVAVSVLAKKTTGRIIADALSSYLPAASKTFRKAIAMWEI
jgi:hypothetical protein